MKRQLLLVSLARAIFYGHDDREDRQQRKVCDAWLPNISLQHAVAHARVLAHTGRLCSERPRRGAGDDVLRDQVGSEEALTLALSFYIRINRHSRQSVA